MLNRPGCLSRPGGRCLFLAALLALACGHQAAAALAGSDGVDDRATRLSATVQAVAGDIPSALGASEQALKASTIHPSSAGPANRRIELEVLEGTPDALYTPFDRASVPESTHSAESTDVEDANAPRILATDQSILATDQSRQRQPGQQQQQQRRRQQGQGQNQGQKRQGQRQGQNGQVKVADNANSNRQKRQQRNQRNMDVQPAASVSQVPVPVPVPVPAPINFSVDMSPRAVQLSPSILIMGYFDWQIIPDASGKPWSRCLDSIWRARRLSRGNKLNFVPTHHWMPGDDGMGVSSFCYMHKGGGGQMQCSPWDQGKIDEFEQGMTLCLSEALRNGFTPYIRPHLDDGYAKGIWRNGLMFSPTQVYDGYTYNQIMLEPLARALNAALRITAQEGTLWPQQDKLRPAVYMALQGEMSATIMRYTSEWQSLIPGIRSTIGTDLADVKIGIGLNFNALDATEASVAQNNGLIGWFVGSGQRANRRPIPPIDADVVNNLISNVLDFIGISAYAPYSGPGMSLNEFENSAFNVADSLRNLANGLNLAGLINSGKLELHFSEFGIGGGENGNGGPALSAAMVGKQPWAGVAGFYSSYRDPWRRSDLQAFRSEFYSKTLQWLANPDIKTHFVCDVFVWGMASWDVFGIYPDSTNSEGTYRDPNIVQMIARHNAKVVLAQTLAAKGPEAALLVQQQINDQEAMFSSYYSQGNNNMPDSVQLEASSTASNDALRQASTQVNNYYPQQQPAPQPAPVQQQPASQWGGLFGFLG